MNLSRARDNDFSLIDTSYRNAARQGRRMRFANKQAKGRGARA